MTVKIHFNDFRFWINLEAPTEYGTRGVSFDILTPLTHPKKFKEIMQFLKS